MQLKYKKTLIILLTCAITLAIGYFFCITNLQIKLQIANKNYLALTAKLHSIETYMRTLSKHEKERSRVPIHTDISSLINSIAEIAKQNTLILKSIQPLPKKIDKKFITNPIRFSVEGKYLNLIKFISAINELYDFIFLQEIQLSKENADNEQILMQGIFVVYDPPRIKDRGGVASDKNKHSQSKSRNI